MFYKRKILSALVAVISSVLLLGLVGCANNVIKKQENEETSTKQTIENTNENEKENENPKYVFDYDHIDDGFNRIAITFHTDSTTKMGLSWYTPNIKDYGEDIEVISKSTGELVEISYEIDSGTAEYDEDSMYHQTVIEGLEPGEEYYFRVGDVKSNKWSEYGSFKTATEDIDEFTFVAVTDTQSDHLPDAYFANNTMERALALAPDSAFIMHSGDFVNKGSKEELWMAQMNASKNILMNNIIAPAVGNHEVQNHAFWQHFKLEHTNNHKTTGIYYSYDYGKVHFVVLDTNKKNEEESSYIDDEQLAWLEDDLKNARKNGAEWIIVNIHRGLYTVGEHSNGELYAGENGMRLRVSAVFEKYDVDLVIQGHDHAPSVTKPLKRGKVVDKKDGIIYINTGAAGYKSYSFDEDIMPQEYYDLFDFKLTGERKDDVYQDFAIVKVSSNSIKVTMYEANATSTTDTLYVLYEFTIQK